MDKRKNKIIGTLFLTVSCLLFVSCGTSSSPHVDDSFLVEVSNEEIHTTIIKKYYYDDLRYTISASTNSKYYFYCVEDMASAKDMHGLNSTFDYTFNDQTFYFD